MQEAAVRATPRRPDVREHHHRAPWRELTAALALIVLASGCAGADPAVDAPETQSPTVDASTVAEPSAVRDAISDEAIIIDVRTPQEFAAGHLRGAANIDVSGPDFTERISSLDKTASYVVYCASGNRAGAAIDTMREQGFSDLINGGGYEELAAFGLPTI